MSSRQAPLLPQSRIEFFENRHNDKLCGRYWHLLDNDSTPDALAFICHGLSEHSGVYEELGYELARKRVLAFSHDHKGHGRSYGVKVMANDMEEYVSDIIDHMKLIRRTHRLMPMFLVAHSMGGMIVIKLVLRYPSVFQGIVFMSPAIIPGPQVGPLDLRVSCLRSIPVRLLLWTLDWVNPEMALGALYPNILTKDKEEQDNLAADPYRWHGGAKVRLIRAMVTGFKDNLSQLSNITTPFLILHGDLDILCNIKGSRLLLNQSRAKDKSMVEYEGAKHQLYIETADIRQSAIKRTVEWILQRVDVSWRNKVQ